MSFNKSNTLKNDIKVFKDPRTLCSAAILAACAVAIAYICKAFTITPSVRFTFENLPLLLSGYIFGPFVGLLTGLTADIVSTATTYGFSGINPILTVGAASVGFICGLFTNYIFTKRSNFQIIFAVLAAHAVSNMGIKTVGLWLIFNTTPLEIAIRIILYCAISALEAFIIIKLLRSNGIRKVLVGKK